MNIVQKMTKLLVRNSPAIFTAVGVAGLVSTAVLTAKATVEAVRKIDEAEAKFGTHGEKWGRIEERFKLVWKSYIPAAVTGGLSIACIIASHGVHTRRNSALLSLYTLTETALREYQDKVVEVIGENKERKIRDTIAQENLDKNPPVGNQVIIANGGDILCYDNLSGRYFTSDIETLRRAQNDINSHIIDHMYASLNQFYGLIGLKSTVMGEEMGWNTDRMLDVDFDTMLSDDQRPCIVLNYRLTPTPNYDRFH